MEHVGGRLAVEPILADLQTPVDSRGFQGEFRYFVHFTRHRALFSFGLAVVLLSLVAAAIGPLVVPYNPIKATMDITQPPSRQHLMGTDASGYDVFSRVVAATRIDLVIALAATAV